MIRRFARFLCIVSVLPLAACGYFTGHWPTLKEDPIPARTEAPAPSTQNDSAVELPGAPEARTPITSADEAATRLTEDQTRFTSLEKQIQAQLAGLNTNPKTPDEWGQAQIGLSRLTRTETDLRALGDAVSTDAGDLQKTLPAQASGFQDLARQIDALVAHVAQTRISAQNELATNRPVEEAPKAPATPLPKGKPALTITAEADPATYSQAVSTLVEKAQAINNTNVYHVVAAPDSVAAKRAQEVGSLLEAGGVAQTRIRTVTDPQAEAGSVRIFVE